jgi:hypothetical protein
VTQRCSDCGNTGAIHKQSCRLFGRERGSAHPLNNTRLTTPQKGKGK